MKRSVTVLIMMVLLSPCSNAAGRSQLPNKCQQDVSASTEKASAVAVDEDGNIWLTGFGRRRKVGRSIKANIVEPADQRFIPASDIVIGREQFTCSAKHWKLVVLNTIHPSVRGEQQSIENRIIGVLFRDSDRKVLLEKTYPEIIKVDLGDVNGDGITELAIQWNDNSLISPATWLEIWQISDDGVLVPVNLENVHQNMNLKFASHGSVIELGAYANRGLFRIFRAEKSQSGWQC